MRPFRAGKTQAGCLPRGNGSEKHTEWVRGTEKIPVKDRLTSGGGVLWGALGTAGIDTEGIKESVSCTAPYA